MTTVGSYIVIRVSLNATRCSKLLCELHVASYILKESQKKIGEFSCIFEERPPNFVFTLIFRKNTLNAHAIYLLMQSNRVSTSITGVFFRKIGVNTQIGGLSSKMHENSPKYI